MNCEQFTVDLQVRGCPALPTAYSLKGSAGNQNLGIQALLRKVARTGHKTAVPPGAAQRLEYLRFWVGGSRCELSIGCPFDPDRVGWSYQAPTLFGGIE